MTYDTLLYERRGPEGRITLNRPHVRNAISVAMPGELREALLQAKADAEVRVVVLTGAGTAFCSGIDLVESAARGSTLHFRRWVEVLYGELHDTHVNLGKPTIAMVNGPARGAGCTLAFMCDMLVAAEHATFALPEVDVGLLPAYHLIHLPRLMGRHKAFQFAFVGGELTAREAERWGVVNDVAPAAELDARVAALVGRFAAKSPLVLKIGKDAFYRGVDVEFRKGIMDAADALAILASSADTREGLTAARDRRPPIWQGQ